MKPLFIFLFALAFLPSFPKIVNAQVVINEMLANHSTGEDWVELYSPVDVDISGWVLDDEAASDMATIPPGTSIGPSSNGFYTVDVGTRLNQSEDTISLYTPGKSTLVDSYNYQSNPGTDISFGRYPDGQSWGICTSTKNSSNSNCSFPTPTPTSTPQSTNTPLPTKTPTPTPAPTKTPMPTPKITPKATIKPTATSSSSSTPESTGSVLGETQEIGLNQSPFPSPTPEPSEKKKFPVAGMFLIGGVLICIVVAGFVFYRNLKKGETFKDEEIV